MAEIVWTEKAVCWLREIFDHIAEDNPDAAKRTIDAIYGKVNLLGQFPELGYRYDRWAHRNVRILIYGHYRIAYLIRSDGDIVIIGVFHAALDMDRYLN